MVVMFGVSFFEPVKKTLWREFLDACPKVSKPKPVQPVLTNRQMAIAAGCGLSLALVYKFRSTLKNLLPGYQRLKTAMGCEPPVVVDERVFDDRRVCLESVRSGSIESSQLKPKCQVFIGEMKAGEFHAVGSAVRMRDYLVMPGHVAAAVDEMCVKGSQHWVKIERDREYLDLDTDLIAYKLSPKELATIGVSQGSISHSLPYTGEFVSVVGLNGKGTTGVLRHDRMVFGRVVYEGTTVAGYSGSPYVSGNRIVGIHTNGGAVNGGYSASYIYSLICWHDKTRDEDSEDWLRKQYSKNKKNFRVDKRWGDLDEVRVEINGRYAVVARKDMAAAFGNDWFDFMDETDRLEQKYYQGGYESAAGGSILKSGESTSSNSGGSSIVENTPDPSLQEVVALVNELAKSSPRRLKAVRSTIRQLCETSDIQGNVLDSLEKKNTQV